MNIPMTKMMAQTMRVLCGSLVVEQRMLALFGIAMTSKMLLPCSARTTSRKFYIYVQRIQLTD